MRDIYKLAVIVVISISLAGCHTSVRDNHAANASLIVDLPGGILLPESTDILVYVDETGSRREVLIKCRIPKEHESQFKNQEALSGLRWQGNYRILNSYENFVYWNPTEYPEFQCGKAVLKDKYIVKILMADTGPLGTTIFLSFYK